jgi:hypothetical protein
MSFPGLTLFAALALAFAATPALATELRCPPRLPGPHPGFEQSGPVPAAHWLLWGMKLFDGRPGKNPPPEFAPDNTVERRDGVTLVWRFTLNQDLLMVCVYNGSGTYYYTQRQAPPGLCVMDDDNGLTRAWCQ